MGHMIYTDVVPENCDRGLVQAKWDERAYHDGWEEGSDGLPSNIRWLESKPICKSEEEAEKLIKELDSGWYDQLAVRFYAPEKVKYTKKVEDLDKRVGDLENRIYQDDKTNYYEGVKSQYITCRSCGSKLATGFVKNYGNRCPVCFKSILPPTEVKLRQARVDKLERLKKELKAERKKCQDKAKKKVMWFVKVEWHC